MSQQPETANTPYLEFVTFTAGGQNYCIEIMQIREIRRWTPVTALPHAPHDVLGVMNLRGTVIPIYDLAARFGFGATEAHERNVIIVAAIEGQTFGLLVQSVSEILSVRTDTVQATPDVKSEATRQSILGVISVDGAMTRVVDLRSVVQTEARAYA